MLSDAERAAQARYRERHREEIRVRRQVFYQANRERLREKAKVAGLTRYRADPKKFNARSRDSYRRNREKYRASAKARYLANREEILLRERLKHYGLTIEQFLAMQQRDPGCAICGRTSNGKHPLGIDHDHVTGRVRGLLCNYCNATLHRLENTPGWIEAAQAYLHR